jgi:ureidoglycolate dehydrogenase (NAD+)
LADQIRRIDTIILDSIMRTILQSENVQDSILDYVVKGLIQTSLRGVDSHGIRLFPHYLEALKAGRINGKPNIKFIMK